MEQQKLEQKIEQAVYSLESMAFNKLTIGLEYEQSGSICYVETLRDLSTEVQAILDKLQYAVNDFLGLGLASKEDLEERRLRALDALPSKLSDDDRRFKISQINRLYDMEPCVETIQILKVKKGTMKHNRKDIHLYDMSVRTASPVTFLAMHVGFKVHVTLDDALHPSLAPNARQIRELVNELFIHMTSHLATHLRQMEIEKEQKTKAVVEAAKQLELFETQGDEAA